MTGTITGIPGEAGTTTARFRIIATTVKLSNNCPGIRELCRDYLAYNFSATPKMQKGEPTAPLFVLLCRLKKFAVKRSCFGRRDTAKAV
jgi:hypothetical protein